MGLLCLEIKEKRPPPHGALNGAPSILYVGILYVLSSPPIAEHEHGRCVCVCVFEIKIFRRDPELPYQDLPHQPLAYPRFSPNCREPICRVVLFFSDAAMAKHSCL